MSSAFFDLKTSFRNCGRHLRVLLALAGLLLFPRLGSALNITNVTAVNVTPSGFSVVWRGPLNGTPALSVFADAAGTVNLAGQLGIELYPVHSGDPTLTNGYAHLQNLDQLTKKIMAQSTIYVRVTGCAPGTKYFYRAELRDATGQPIAVSPATGPLPAVTTALENSFVLQSRQLLITLPGGNPTGSLVLLSNPNTPSVLAGVVGDGAGPNQVFFNLDDVLAAGGATNYLPLGGLTFTASVLGTSTNGLSQAYGLVFTGSFLVGQSSGFNLGTFLGLSVGSAVVRSGASGSLPILLNASTAITNVSVLLQVDTNHFTSLSLQGLVPQLGTPTFQSVGSNLFLLKFPAASGQNLLGNQAIAQINFTAASNQPSAFVPFTPGSLQGLNVDGSPALSLGLGGGRVVIIDNQPLLEATQAADGSRNLTLFGKDGASYQVQFSTNLLDSAAWTDQAIVALSGMTQDLPGQDTTPPEVYFRAYEFTPSSGMLKLQAAPDGRVSATAFGRPGARYTLEYATSPAAGAHWLPLVSYTLTNSFTTVANLGKTNSGLFFRLQNAN